MITSTVTSMLRLESLATKDLKPGDFVPYYGWVETIRYGERFERVQIAHTAHGKIETYIWSGEITLPVVMRPIREAPIRGLLTEVTCAGA